MENIRHSKWRGNNSIFFQWIATHIVIKAFVFYKQLSISQIKSVVQNEHEKTITNALYYIIIYVK